MTIGPTNSLAKTASWIIRRREDKSIVCETFDPDLADRAACSVKYEAVPILEYLQSINGSQK